MPLVPLRHNTDSVARLLKAVANGRRLAILCELSDGERSVSNLQDVIGISQSALSQHLARLRRDGLVVTRRDAQNIYYRVSANYVQSLLDYLNELSNDHTLTQHSRVGNDNALDIAAE